MWRPSKCDLRTALTVCARAGDVDGTSIELAFSKKKIEERKAWLRAFVPGTFLDHTAEEISYSDFINRELILFSRADVERSIPSMLDGLKPGQRKILYSCFKRNLKNDIKVCSCPCWVKGPVLPQPVNFSWPTIASRS